MQSLEEDLELLCITGVEDQLQVRGGREGGRREGGEEEGGGREGRCWCFQLNSICGWCMILIFCCSIMYVQHLNC